MLLTVIAIGVVVCLGVILWNSATQPKAFGVRRGKASRREPGPWDSGDNERRGAR